MADTKKRKDVSSLEKRKPRTNDESFDEDDLDDGKISKATKISDAQQHQVEQIVLKAKLESKARLKYAHATDNELCEPKRDGPEVNFPTSKEEYEELRQRHSKAAAKTTTKEGNDDDEMGPIVRPDARGVLLLQPANERDEVGRAGGNDD